MVRTDVCLLNLSIFNGLREAAVHSREVGRCNLKCSSVREHIANIIEHIRSSVRANI